MTKNKTRFKGTKYMAATVGGFLQRSLFSAVFFMLMGAFVLMPSSCTKRNHTEFSARLEADRENPMSQEEFVKAIGKEKYDAVILAMGEDNFNRLSFTIGSSNTIQLVNAIANPSRLTEIMTGVNALTGGEVADLLITIDNQVAATGTTHDDTILKIVNLINQVNNMQWMKDLVKGAKENTRSIPNFATNQPINRLGRLIAGVNENLATMTTLLNDISPTNRGLGRLLKLINGVNAPDNMAAIINGVQTSSTISNLIGVIKDLEMDDACSNTAYETPQRCTLAGGTWNTNNPDGIDILIRIINENGTCSDQAYFSDHVCIANGKTWTSKASDMATVINQLQSVKNLNELIKHLTYDDKSPGEPGDVMTGTDALIATLKKSNDVTKLTKIINKLDEEVSDNSNDDDFEGAATECGTATRTPLKKFQYAVKPMDSGANKGKDSFFVNSATGASGACAAQSDPTLGDSEEAAFEYTANITEAGPMSFKYKVSSESPSTIKKITVTAGGSGYTSAPTVSFSGGGGSGATATAKVGTGALGQVNLTNAGSGYTDNPTVTVTGGGGSGAIVQAQRIPQAITTLTLTNGGSYSTAPTVRFGAGGSGAAATAIIPAAPVNTIQTIYGGKDYTSPATCTINGGGGSGATCATANTYKLSSINVDNENGCFNATDVYTCTVTGGGGVDATCEVQRKKGGCWFNSQRHVYGVQVTSQGKGYTSAPTIVITRQGNTVGSGELQVSPNMVYDGGLRVTLTNAGSGYTSNPNITFSGGGGAGVAAKALLSLRAITGITLTNGGKYFKVPDIEFIGGDGSGATATATVPASALRNLTISNGGSGYTSAPTLTISGGGGNGATGTASVVPMSVNEITMNNIGSGYTTAPTVTISGGGGSGATAKAMVSGDYFKFYIDDELVLITYGNSGAWNTYTSASISKGTHRFRWEYVKDDSNSVGDNQVLVDDIVLPGNRGGLRTPVQKVAILMNKLVGTSMDNVAEMLNGLSDPAGLDALTKTLNKVEYPADINEMPKLVDIVNQLNDVQILYDMFNNITDQGVDNLVALVDSVQSRNKLTALVKNLSGGSPGIKMTQILNTLSSQGTGSMVKILDTLTASDPVVDTDEFWELIRLINGVSSTALFPAMLSELSITGRQSTVLNTSAAPTGGAKLALFIRAVRNKSISSGDAATCDTNKSSFCVKNQVVRLVDELSAIGSGAKAMGKIVNNADPDAVTKTGVERIAEVLYSVKTYNTNKYANALSNNSVDHFGRLVYLISDMGDAGVDNISRLTNELDAAYIDGRLGYMVKNSNRVRYLSRLMSDLTNIDLVLNLLNNTTTNVIKVNDLVNRQGNLTYGIGAMGTNPASTHSSGNNCGMETNTVDKYGKLLCLMNEVSGSGINNIVKLINNTYDLNIMSSESATFNYGPKTDGHSHGLINAVHRVRYLTELINNVANIDLFVNILNGENGDMSNGADFSSILPILNNVGGSTRKGPGTKVVGDMKIVSDLINLLGYNPNCPCNRPISDQMRILVMVNNVKYCGVKPQYDRDANPGTPVSEYYTCDDHVDYAYDKTTDTYDRRHRMSNYMLGMTNAEQMAIIVGDVNDPLKTVRSLNGTRRINTLMYTIDWMPGEVTMALLNTLDIERVSTGLVYMVNNLDPDEDKAAQAFTQMMHYGTGIPGGLDRNGSCTWFTGIGPTRLAGLMNAEPGLYLESILTMFGWRTSIPSMVCGLGAHNTSPAWTQTVAANTEDSGTATDGSQCTSSDPCQKIPGSLKDVLFKNKETLAITNSPTPGPRHGTSYTHVYRTKSQTDCESYMPEESGALGLGDKTDYMVARGISKIIGIVKVPAGIGGVWDTLKGKGFVGWLLSNNGKLGSPPLVNPSAGSCTNSSYTTEWDCIKHGKNNPPHVSTYRWGDYCSIPGYSDATTCENNNGRWMPNKNYTKCQIDSKVNAPIE